MAMTNANSGLMTHPSEEELQLKYRGIKPLGNRVVIKMDEAADRSDGGILLPDQAKEQRPSKGTVVAVGPGAIHEKTGERIPMEVRVGQRVLYGKWAGVIHDHNGEELLFANAEEIVASIEEE